MYGRAIRSLWPLLKRRINYKVTTPLLFKLIPAVVHLGVLLRWFSLDLPNETKAGNGTGTGTDRNQAPQAGRRFGTGMDRYR
uniref:Uncharacterized protein n=1 Tax=Solanum lycopersicum TaxID=4081 RepID=A0A3Q7GG69_SOLLC